jgi:hypothetical protein
MRTPKELKKEWLRFSGLDTSADDRWLRDKIASLFDIRQPNEAQEKLLWLADKHLTRTDLPSGGWHTHKAELMALASAEFGPPPEPHLVAEVVRGAWRGFLVIELGYAALVLLGVAIYWLARLLGLS